MANDIRPAKRLPSSFDRHGGVFNHHIPCVLRAARYCPHGRRYHLFTRGCHVVRDVRQDESSQTLQLGIQLGTFVQRFRIFPRGGVTEVEGNVRLGDCKKSSQFSRLHPYHSLATISPSRVGPSPTSIRHNPYTSYTTTPGPVEGFGVQHGISFIITNERGKRAFLDP